MENTLHLIKEKIDTLPVQNRPVLISIDGKCASGKTTLAAALAQIYDCNVFHMDDFFLRPEQRTEARFAEVGGNVDYERFYAEVLLPLKAGHSFSYRPFDCQTGALSQPVSVVPKKLTIIEGTYSQHPYFGDPYDVKFLLTVPPQLQRQRVLARPAFLHKQFFEVWIPMENLYFEAFSIAEKAHLVL